MIGAVTRFYWLLLAIGLTIGSAVGAEPRALRWGADIESGAPFAYKDPSSPDRVIGFEADIVEAIGRELGMPVVYRQNEWSGLVEGLKRGDYDMVVNGLEITPDRAEVVNFSIPYYLTSESLFVRRSTDTIAGLGDLESKRVGTLTGSLAQRILTEQDFPLEVKTYSEEYHAYNDLALGRLEAVLLDEPIAIYYGRPDNRLKGVGGAIGRLEYGIATRKEDRELAANLDRALRKLIADGTIRAILEKWGLWNEMTARAWNQSVEPVTPATAYQEYLKTAFSRPEWRDRLLRYVSFLPLLARGAWMTLQISVLSMALAMLVGLFTALTRLYGPRPAAWTATAFVEVFRGTPLLIQLFLIFYGLPNIGIRLDPYLAAVIGLGLNYAACEAENYRAGIMSIPKAQMDASQALGMTRNQALRHIILPQAIRVVIPPVTNDFIALLKDSSLVSVITMVELTATYGQLASTYFDYLGIGILTAAIYFLIGLPFVRLSRRFERNLNAHLNKPKTSGGRPSPMSVPLRLFSAAGKR